jgi:hypothetical protein
MTGMSTVMLGPIPVRLFPRNHGQFSSGAIYVFAAWRRKCAAEFAYLIAELELAHWLRSAINELDPGEPITVVGGGPTGIKAAGRPD